jgi:hypothetical protein
MVALLTFGIVLNIVNIFQVPLFINRLIEYVATGNIVVPVIALGFVVPLFVAITAAVFGSILAAAEGWSFVDGLYYVFSNLLGLGTPLTDVTPQTVGGDVIDIIVSSFALGCVAVFVDYVTVLNPARYVRKKFKDFLDKNGVSDLNHPDIPDRRPLDDDQEPLDNDSISNQESIVPP